MRGARGPAATAYGVPPPISGPGVCDVGHQIGCSVPFTRKEDPDVDDVQLAGGRHRLRASRSHPTSGCRGAGPSGLGAQHVVAMFGATFVFPVVMGLDPNLAIMFSGICTILFLLITSNKVPSYLGTSASFVASVTRDPLVHGGDSADVTGAILVAGLVLLAVGVLVHFAGSGVIHKVLPPAVTGAVVMLIGFNLAPVVAGIYWPQDQWIALAIATFMVCAAVLLPGFWARIAVLLALVFGYVLSWLGRRALRADQQSVPAPSTDGNGAEGRTALPRRPTGSAGRGEGRGLDRVPERHADERRRLGRARAELLAHLHPARAARRDRADRGEHRARQGRRRDDEDRPRPLHGPSAGRRRLRRPPSRARSAARPPRRTPRTSA